MYKIIKDNLVIDVSNVYLAENAYNHALIRTSKDNIHFLLASDGVTLYKAPWCYEHITSKYQATPVDAVEITQEEYDQLKQQLQLNYTILAELDKPNETIADVSEKEPEPQVLNVADMQRKIEELEMLVKQLLNK